MTLDQTIERIFDTIKEGFTAIFIIIMVIFLAIGIYVRLFIEIGRLIVILIQDKIFKKKRKYGGKL